MSLVQSFHLWGVLPQLFASLAFHLIPLISHPNPFFWPPSFPHVLAASGVLPPDTQVCLCNTSFQNLPSWLIQIVSQSVCSLYLTLHLSSIGVAFNTQGKVCQMYVIKTSTSRVFSDVMTRGSLTHVEWHRHLGRNGTDTPVKLPPM